MEQHLTETVAPPDPHTRHLPGHCE